MTVVERPRLAPPQVGRSAPRRDAAEKLRGEAQFAGDIVLPRMLHGKVKRSPVPHARVVSVDAREAEAMPGVACVLDDDFVRAQVRTLGVGFVAQHDEVAGALDPPHEAIEQLAPIAGPVDD